MKLISQMQNQYREISKRKKTAKENNDRDTEMICEGIRMALEWVQQSKQDEYLIDNSQIDLATGKLSYKDM